MQASAQIQELQAKYKGNPQKLNQEMAELYKRENYIPDVGCLPLLIQFPAFHRHVQPVQQHFDLRGAMFIGGWINDLLLCRKVSSISVISQASNSRLE